jgi:hypothetical protein
VLDGASCLLCEPVGGAKGTTTIATDGTISTPSIVAQIGGTFARLQIKNAPAASTTVPSSPSSSWRPKTCGQKCNSARTERLESEVNSLKARVSESRSSRRRPGIEGYRSAGKPARILGDRCGRADA